MVANSLSSSQYIIKATAETPEVSLDDQGTVFSFTGNCYPPNPDEFFSPVLNWIRDFFERTPEISELMFNIHLNYINSSSYKYLLELVSLLKDYQSETRKFHVNWFYFPHDAEMKELGETITEHIQFPMNMVLLS